MLGRGARLHVVANGRRHGQGLLLCSRSLSTTLSAEELEKKFVMPTYSKGGVRSKEGLVFERGFQSTLVDREGKQYIDLGSGIAVTVLGHCDEEWKNAACDQLGKLAHTSNLYHTGPYLELAEKLVKNSPGMGKVFFCNSGTEATEGAIKFARVFQNAQGEGSRNRFVSFKKSFHGRSLGALSLTYKPAIREPFAPMLIPRVDHIDYNDIKALESTIGPDVIAVVMEPVQGEGGINPATREFVKRARELCDENGCILIFDEVQIGLGRQGNGRLWSYEEYGVVPDAVTMAKPLANGLPIGAVMISERMFSKVPETAWLGTHGSTFAANPVVTRAANVVLDKLLAPGFLDRVKDTGAHMIQALDAMKDRVGEKIRVVRRPLGDAALYAGIQLPGPFVGPVIAHCINNGVVVISAGDDGSVLRLCPPLVITKEEIDKALKVLEEAIQLHVPVPSKPAGLSTEQAPPPKLMVEFISNSLAASSAEEYETKLQDAEHTKLPLGFKVGTTHFTFFPEELPRTPSSKPATMKLSLIVPEAPTSKYAALFTNNAFPGAPVRIGREIVKKKSPISAVVINNKISNVHPRGSGIQDAQKVCDAVASLVGSGTVQAAVFPSSTGVIGWRLPVDSMIQALPQAEKTLQAQSVLPAAKGIMTTDTFPKARSCVIRDSQGNEYGRFTGIAKGAGMIEPNMATMLVYILTDIDADANVLEKCLRKAVNSEGSFNRISVDSDQSTSDTILLLSSQKMPSLPAAIEESVITEALSTLCSELAQDVVRNGEGTQHVVKVKVNSAPSQDLAHGVAKAVVNSPLVKTAIAGNDANVGRIIAAVGSYIGKFNPAWASVVSKKCQILVGDQVVFENGEFCIDDKKEVLLTEYMKSAQLSPSVHFPEHYQTVDITINLQGADRKEYGHASMVFGSDLTHTYVDVNAGYRS